LMNSRWYELAELFEGEAEFWAFQNEDGRLLGTYDLDNHEEYDEAYERFYHTIVSSVESHNGKLRIWLEV